MTLAAKSLNCMNTFKGSTDALPVQRIYGACCGPGTRRVVYSASIYWQYLRASGHPFFKPTLASDSLVC